MTCKIEAVSLSFQLRLSEHLQIEDTGEERLDTSMKKQVDVTSKKLNEKVAQPTSGAIDNS